MGMDKNATDIWLFGRLRPDLSAKETWAEAGRRSAPWLGTPEAHAKGPYEEANRELGRVPREDEFMDTIPGLDPRCRAKR
jgi:hypothetical protein